MTQKPSSLEFVTIEEARQRGYDTCQIKYDGMWSRHEISNGVLRVYLADETSPHYLDVPSTINATLIGDYFYGPRWAKRTEWFGKVMIYDCTGIAQGSNYYTLHELIYKDRYALARAVLEQLGNKDYMMIKNYPIKLAEEVWEKQVIPNKWKGLIFRDSTKPSAPVLCQRFYPELPGDPKAIKEMLTK